MYIEYCTPQYHLNYTSSSKKLTKAGGGLYRPTWLIQTSNWEKVPGNEATEGYCTFSYCWEQSGEIIQTENGDYKCIDNFEHQLKTTSLLSRRPEIQKTNYEGILKAICTEFNISYLWYDKICIDQLNKDERRREINQMHLIYSNSRYTVAFIPEVSATGFLDVISQRLMESLNIAEREVYRQVYASKWWKRSWTLEELMVSTNILIVGKNVHMWACSGVRSAHALRSNNYFISNMLGYKHNKVKSANTVLHHAHFRTSTKGHDKIFALGNILSDTISIDTNYEVEISTAMNTFYRQLAQKDLTVLCFGSISMALCGKSTMGSYDLPSWTGTAGLHTRYPVADTVLDQSSGNPYVDDSMHLHITSRFFTVQPEKYDTCFDGSDDSSDTTSISDKNGHSLGSNRWRIMEKLTGCSATHFCAIRIAKSIRAQQTSPLSLTEDCDDCIVPGVLFDVVSSFFSHTGLRGVLDSSFNHAYVLPVLKSVAGTQRYKAIGIILLDYYTFRIARKDPHTFLDNSFGDLCSKKEPKEFIIE